MINCIKITMNSPWRFSGIGIGTAKEVVGQHLFVGGAVAVEVVGKHLSLGYMGGGEDGVELVAGIEAAEAALHDKVGGLAVGVRQQTVNQQQRGVGPAGHETVSTGQQSRGAGIVATTAEKAGHTQHCHRKKMHKSLHRVQRYKKDFIKTPATKKNLWLAEDGGTRGGI
jgi:hypothetical protein